MSGVIFNVVSPEITLTASTTKSMLQVTAAANHRIKILGYTVSFNEPVGDATPAQPIILTLGTQTGGSGGTSVTPIKRKGTETVLTTATHTLTSAATTTAIEKQYVNSQTGISVMFPMGQEIEIAGSGIFGIDVTTGTLSSATLKGIFNLLIEE